MAWMAEGGTDLDELREDLTGELVVLLGDLKGLGYDMSHIPDTRAWQWIPRFQNYGSRSSASRK